MLRLQVLYLSIHRYDGGRFYPCDKYANHDSVGVGAGEGSSVNVPWPGKGAGDAEYLAAFHQVLPPAPLTGCIPRYSRSRWPFLSRFHGRHVCRVPPGMRSIHPHKWLAAATLA